LYGSVTVVLVRTCRQARAFSRGAAVVVMVSMPAVAAAQTGSERIADARSGAAAHLGWLYFNPALNVDYLGVDDNVFLDPKTGDPQSDFLAIVSPQVRIWLPVAKRALVSTTLSPRIEYYRRFVKARSVMPQTQVRGDLFLGRIGLFGTGQLRQGRERPSFEIDSRARYKQTDVGVGVSLRLRSRLSVEVSGYRNDTRFDSNELFRGARLRDTLDRREEGFRVTARHRLSPKTSVSVAGESVHSTFAFSPERNSTGFRVMPGVDFTPNALVSGSAYVGVRRLRPRTSVLPGFTGVIADVHLAYTLRGATRFAGTWKRDVSPSYEALQPYFVLQTLGVSIRRQVVKRLDVIAAFDRNQSDYRTFRTVAGAAPRMDVTRTYSGDLGVRLNRQSRLGFVVSRSDRRSDRQGNRDYGRRRMGLSFSYGT
jgi:hypothetical protein